MLHRLLPGVAGGLALPVALWLTGLAVVSCSPAHRQTQGASLRQQLEQQVDLARKAPLVLRWNPAPCDCPPFEVQVASRWMRAELRGGDVEKIQQWTAFLAGLPPESLPVAVEVRGELERGVHRLANGNFAARVEIAEPLSPLAPTAAVPEAQGP